ncbi:trypsin-like peptidase domain-containing protein [Nocardia salmonicida]|uniref:trypsin-like peptidase domain-containing protein n=1 Tax=Nocardia salmonicida TaxID=53431 RepID=UPI00366C05F3
MTDLLDTLPFDWTRPEAQELLDILARSYYRDPEVERLVLQVGMSPADLNWSQPMVGVWHDLLSQARNQNRLRDLVDAATRDRPAIAGRIGELVRPAPIVEAPAATDSQPHWYGSDDPKYLEAQIFDKPTLLDVAFMARGAAIAAAVCRLLVTMRSGRYYGTAFRIGADLLLTNHHVLYDIKYDSAPSAREVQAWFHYELGADNQPREPLIFQGRVETIVGEKRDDWAVIRVDSTLPDDIPVIGLTTSASVVADDRVNIIQHPSGGLKKIGIHHNLVRHVDDRVVQYWTDTEPGSSGAPVFDNDWNLVALHRAGVGSTELARGKNFGTTIGRVISGLQTAGIDLV